LLENDILNKLVIQFKNFRVVNDSMHSVTIKGLPKAASPLGALVGHDIFQVNLIKSKPILKVKNLLF